MINTNFFKSLTVVLTALLFVSCDKDYNTLGSDVIGNENFLFEKYDGPLSVKVYNQKVGPVQTNNLTVNQLGIFKDEIFGVTKANFVTQLTLGTLAPQFGANMVVDSVVLEVPYFSTKESGTDTSGRGIYTLNSVYGDGKLNLSVYENGFLLNDFDPATGYTTAQKFFSDQDGDFNTNKKGLPISDPVLGKRLNNSATPDQNKEFIPKATENVKYKVKSVKNTLTPYTMLHSEEPKTKEFVESRTAPSMRLRLDKDYFIDRIINAGAANLIDNNSFKSYFKGLYFQVEAVDANTTLMKLDFRKGKVTIYYKEDLIVKDANGVVLGNDRPMKTLALNMTGSNTVNLFDVSGNTTIPVVDAPDNDLGDQKLYLKGGQGSQAYIELFKGTELDQLKAKKVLVNDASLTFTLAETDYLLPYDHPKRVYLFDADNDKLLLDFLYDNSTNSSDPKLNKSIHGGILEEKDGKKRYKIRITEHINNILKEAVGSEKENVRLALVITEDINNPNYRFLKTPANAPSFSDNTKKLKTFPVGAVVNHLGTVLYGNNSGITANDVKFEIYYTKPN